MKNHFSHGMIALAFLVLSWTGLTAQPINMGANPINFGTACNSSFIRNTSATSLLQFGINSFCVGPTFSADLIVMDLFNIRMGIGVTAPSFQLQLASNSAAKPGSSSWTVVADRRLKQDVTGFSDGLAAVRGIKPVKFHYSDVSGFDTKQEYVGVLAQELQEVAPYMVQETQITDKTGKQSDYLAVDFGAMDFVLVNAVKELDAELQVQKAENEVLRTALADIRTEIDALKAASGVTSSALVPSLTVSPNPASTEATIACTLPAGARSAEVQVIGLDGKLYSSMAVNVQSKTPVLLNTQTLAVGTYVVKLVADGKVVASTRLVTQQ